MKHHRYTNKDERPVPRYMTGDVAWKKCGWNGYDVEYTVIRAVCDVRWVDYSDNPYWNDVPHGEITYRHKPKWNERMVQNPIDEEALYDTEAEAMRAMFDEFADDTRRILGQFGKRFNQLGITDKTMTILLENIKKDENTETDIRVDKT